MPATVLIMIDNLNRLCYPMPTIVDTAGTLKILFLTTAVIVTHRTFNTQRSMKNQPVKKNRGLVWKVSRSIPNKRLKLKHKSGMSI